MFELYEYFVNHCTTRLKTPCNKRMILYLAIHGIARHEHCTIYHDTYVMAHHEHCTFSIAHMPRYIITCIQLFDRGLLFVIIGASAPGLGLLVPRSDWVLSFFIGASDPSLLGLELLD